MERAFKLTYPNAEIEKHKPATSILTMGVGGLAAFPDSPRTAWDGHTKYHAHLAMHKRSTTRDDAPTAGASRKNRTVFSANGEMADRQHFDAEIMMWHIRDYIGRQEALRGEYLVLLDAAYERASVAERKELNRLLAQLAACLEANVEVIRNFRKAHGDLCDEPTFESGAELSSAAG